MTAGTAQTMVRWLSECCRSGYLHPSATPFSFGVFFSCAQPAVVWFTILHGKLTTEIQDQANLTWLKSDDGIFEVAKVAVCPVDDIPAK